MSRWHIRPAGACAEQETLRSRGYRLPETTRRADGLAGDPAFRLPRRRIG